MLRVELPRIVLIVLAATGLIGLFFGFDQLSKSDVDIQLRDTYLVTHTFGLGVQLFLWLTYFYYLFIQLIGKFRMNTSTFMLLVVNAFLLAFYVHLYFQLKSTFWDIGPDYETVSTAMILDSSGFWGGIQRLMIFIQIFLALTFFYTVFRSIKTYKSK